MQDKICNVNSCKNESVHYMNCFFLTEFIRFLAKCVMQLTLMVVAMAANLLCAASESPIMKFQLVNTFHENENCSCLEVSLLCLELSAILRDKKLHITLWCVVITYLHFTKFTISEPICFLSCSCCCSFEQYNKEVFIKGTVSSQFISFNH